MNDNWLDKIHDRMTDFETEEPAGLWSAIENRRKATPGVSNMAKIAVIKMRIRRVAAVAALLAVICTIAFYLFIDNGNEQVTLSLSTKSDARTKNILKENINILAAASAPEPNLSVPVNDENSKRNEQIELPLPTQANIGDTLVTREISTSDRYVEEENNPPRPTMNLKSSGSHEDSPVNVNINSDKAKRTISDNLSFSLFSSTGTGSSFGSRSPREMFVGSVGANSLEWADNPMLGVLVFNQQTGIETKVRHRLPIRTGISFAYRINDRFDIESGVTYTNLTSEIKEGSENHYLKSEQRLHYLGVPLSLKYHIYSWKRLGLYTSAGILAEKCVSAKLDKKFILNKKEIDAESGNIPEKPMQWSANISVGVQCGITPSIGLFAEPGVSYYFDDGSDLQTIYKDKPLNFNLNVGLRFSFGK